MDRRSTQELSDCVCVCGGSWAGGHVTGWSPSGTDECYSQLGSPLCLCGSGVSQMKKQEHSQLCRVSAPVLQPELREEWLPPSFRVIPGPSFSPMFQLLLSPWAAIIYWVLVTKETVSSDMFLSLSVWSSFHRLCVHAMAKSVSEKWWGEKKSAIGDCWKKALVYVCEGEEWAVRLVTYDPITCPCIEKFPLSLIHEPTLIYPNDGHFYVKMTVFLLMCGNVSKKKKTGVCLAFLLTAYICRWLASVCL